MFLGQKSVHLEEFVFPVFAIIWKVESASHLGLAAMVLAERLNVASAHGGMMVGHRKAEVCLAKDHVS